MKKWVMIYLISLLCVACSAAEAMNAVSTPFRQMGLPNRLTIPNDFVPKDLNILAMGDSLTEGVGDGDHNGGYVSDVKEKLLSYKGIRSVNVTNLGKRGLRISQLNDMIRENEQAVQEADVILITIGGNDVMKIVRSHLFDLTYSLFEKKQKVFAIKLHELIGTLRSLNPHATIVLIGLYNPFSSPLQAIPEIDKVIDFWNGGSKEVLRQYDHTVFVEIKDLFDNRDDLLYSDQFHPNEQGYQLIAERVYQQLLRSIQQ
ncbi:SGNH/GDSL hydrolase family protein [Anoxybacillus tepidamans]|uniref:SGNH/GDSL hydrolase family protein n=1 Tax=Anoxybacteroides tepidamans TaxID=265948 RepID=UPI0004851681|nr:SGNH/GDSL hydrolase family protein [Anoxybacillus tepidamans]